MEVSGCVRADVPTDAELGVTAVPDATQDETAARGETGASGAIQDATEVAAVTEAVSAGEPAALDAPRSSDEPAAQDAAAFQDAPAACSSGEPHCSAGNQAVLPIGSTDAASPGGLPEAGCQVCSSGSPEPYVLVQITDALQQSSPDVRGLPQNAAEDRETLPGSAVAALLSEPHDDRSSQCAPAL